ncbi:hypothetical protein Dxin01_01932 [Deinococcus xinjiangensis]|uniref:Uncharacterized protein n=1 Tax=Deinococcus xinjiangensis TaxID=457454 RepID=A0ABP9VFT1_9DEIO
MYRIWNATEIEYRDRLGIDRSVKVDLWTDLGGLRAVLVLRDLPQMDWPQPANMHASAMPTSAMQGQARAALEILTQDWLPYILRPDAQVLVLALHPKEDQSEKARALVLPLSA